MFKKMILGLMIKLAKFFIDKVYDYIDADHNGELSKKELLNAYKDLKSKVNNIKKIL